MAKKKRNHKNSKYPTVVIRQEHKEAKKSNKTKAFNWFMVTLGAIIVAAVFNFVLNYVTGNVQLNFKESKGRNFVFTIKNNSSTNQVIDNLRFVPDFDQSLIFKITEKGAGYIKDGVAFLKDGNSTYIPIAEYNDLDGLILESGVSKSFLTPPLTQWGYVEPEALFIYANYTVSSENKFIKSFEEIVRKIWSSYGTKSVRYLVSGGFWSPSENMNKDAATKIVCRDDLDFSKSDICKKYGY